MADKNNKDKNLLMEQYKLYVGTAEKNSDRRQISNNFFLAFNSVILTGTGYLATTEKDLWLILVSILGLVSAFLWVTTINSFRQINTGKFKVIHEIEKKLPYPLFKKEWKYLGEGKNKKKYIKLTVVESGIPYVFMIMYGLFILLKLIPFLLSLNIK
jgi:hypothetical protein